MEKLLKLINEYEESRWETIDDWLTEEERENWAIIEEQPTRKEYEWHLRHCNAKTVAYEKDTFDAYALSKKYGFIRWLNDRDMLKPKEIYQQAILDQIKEWHEWEAYTQWLALSDNPISDLISMLK
jgi:hypothetical protein